ncbi:hypothetical protein H3C66_04825 [Patescibacteria group bacterium]|nr:hypothetical protein [Patescibacteria group bacterium]
MGNIVSNAVVPDQLPPAQGGGVVTPPMSGVAPVGDEETKTPDTSPAVVESSSLPEVTISTTNAIEGIGSSKPSGYHDDPFGAVISSSGPQPQPTPQLPSISADEPPSITADPLPPAPPPPPFTPVSKGDEETHQSAAALLGKMPDIETMMKDLEKSGCLLPELQIKSSQKVDTSPLAALQPKHLQDQSFFSSPSDQQPMKVLPDVQLANSGKAGPPAPHSELPIFVFVSIIALIQAIQGIVQFAHFWLVKYSLYEQMIVANVITTLEVNTAVVKSLLLGIFAIVGLISGVALLLRRASSHAKLTYFVIALIIINFLIQNVLGRQEFGSGNPLHLPELLAEIMAR